MCLLITGSLWATHQFMACLNKNNKGKLVKYGEKRDEKVSHKKCESLLEKQSYKHGKVFVCQLKIKASFSMFHR